MKHTAVEQLQVYLSISLGRDRMRMLFNEFEKAKEMEKEQIIEAHTIGYIIGGGNGDLYNPKEYYNETFKQQEQ
jgi:hypothetical protein